MIWQANLFFSPPRQWKQLYVVLQDMSIHFYKDQKTARVVSDHIEWMYWA